MEQIFLFLILSLSMFAGSYFTGYMPVYITSKTHSVSSISTFGAGLMIGVLLMIIIPEGVSAIYRAGFLQVKNSAIASGHSNDPIINIKYEEIEANKEYSLEMHQYIGIYIMSGFLTMLIIEQSLKIYENIREKQLEDIEGVVRSPGHTHQNVHSDSPGSENPPHLIRRKKVSYGTKVILIGILLHCLADGFAFGTSGYSILYKKNIPKNSSGI